MLGFILSKSYLTNALVLLFCLMCLTSCTGGRQVSSRNDETSSQVPYLRFCSKDFCSPQIFIDESHSSWGVADDEAPASPIKWVKLPESFDVETSQIRIHSAVPLEQIDTAYYPEGVDSNGHPKSWEIVNICSYQTGEKSCEAIVSNNEYTFSIPDEIIENGHEFPIAIIGAGDPSLTYSAVWHFKLS
ncbi:hypothetical protein [Mobiluncus sp.]|uniref:hypothetical protein n=1 Tax=Mobiluncus sp. TaxID=47293 RepID=UPI002A909A49|nr:hypothetical protein [Mobiluncus sp.]MDY6076246.1 hypothetical protein [Mobiluncus sp.]